MYQRHPDEEVQQAIVRLCDKLCTWERSTGLQSLLVIIEPGFEFIADCGKPIPDDSRLGMTVEEFVKSHREHHRQT